MQEVFSVEEINPVVHEAGIQHMDSWRTKPRRIYDYQFLYCFTGKTRIKIEDREYVLTVGDMAIIPPDTPHCLWIEEGQEKGDSYWFHCDLIPIDDGNWIFQYYNTPELYVRLFSGRLSCREHIRKKLVLREGYMLPEVITPKNRDKVEIIFRTIYKSYRKNDERFTIIAKQRVLELLDILFLETGYYEVTSFSQQRVAQQIVDFIQHNYFRKLTVKEICEYTHLNTDYAGKLFHEQMGESLISYLNRFRIEKAQRVLLNEELTIADVAERVGFQNENYFCSVCKKISGRTPGQLRQYMLYIMDQSE